MGALRVAKSCADMSSSGAGDEPQQQHLVRFAKLLRAPVERS
jgi:hypothetical protein